MTTSNLNGRLTPGKASILLFFTFFFHFSITINAQDGWSGVWRPSTQNHAHYYWADWSQMTSKNSQYQENGYRMTDIETHYSNGKRKFYAVWKKDNSETRYFQTKVGFSQFMDRKKQLGNSYTLIDVETYISGGRTYYLGLWKKKKSNHRLGQFSSWSSLNTRTNELKNLGYSVVDLEVFRDANGNTKYVGIWHKTSKSDKNRIFHHNNYNSFKSVRQSMANQGWRLVDYEREKIGSATIYISIYEKAGGAYAFYSNLNFLSFRSHRSQKNSKNMQLVDFEVHQTGNPANSIPAIYDYKSIATPDLSQVDDLFPSSTTNGNYCGPTAASNGLVWLDKQGYSQMVTGSGKQAQVNLVVLLATGTYMNTEANGGTGARDIVEGLDEYLQDIGYSYEKLEMQGWRCLNSDYQDRIVNAFPDIDWIKEGVLEKSMVLLNFGWYNYNQVTRRYTRNGGHWVTAIGYGVDQVGNTDPNCIIVHDPSSRTPEDVKQKDFVKLTPAARGFMVNGTSNACGIPNSSNGYMSVAPGSTLALPSGRNAALLDAVVVLRMD